MPPRGVAGTALLYKLLGAAAFQGEQLDSVLAIGKRLLDGMKTMGVCLESCTLPGQSSKSHSLEQNQMEMGMGIHGEQGRCRVEMRSAGEAVRSLLGELVAATPPGQVVMMLNNIGGVSQLEMGILVGEAITGMQQQKQHQVVRLVAGQVMTSIDM